MMTKTELLDSFYDFSSFFEVVEAIANDETKKEQHLRDMVKSTVCEYWLFKRDIEEYCKKQNNTPEQKR